MDSTEDLIHIKNLNEIYFQPEKSSEVKISSIPTEKIKPKKEKNQIEKNRYHYHPEKNFFFETIGNNVVLRCKPSERKNPEEEGQGRLDCVIKSTHSSSSSSSSPIFPESEIPAIPEKHDLFAKYRNSVVQLISINFKTNPIQPHESIQSGKSLGSAFFISYDGLLVTNAHVVIKSAQLVIKREIEGEKLFPVRVYNVCPGKDCAILKMSKKTIFQLKQKIIPFDFGDSDFVKVPSEVSAWGYQLGMPDIKMTIGNLGGHHRELAENNRSSSFLQITAPIVHGSSGGCLLNVEGKVVGINTQGLPSAGASVGFAIPSKVLFSILGPLLAKNAYPDKIVPVPTLSFMYQTCNRALLQAHNVDTTKYKGGLYVSGRNCPYTLRNNEQQLDIQQKDIILEIRCIHPYADYKNYLNINTYKTGYFFPSSSCFEKKTTNRLGRSIIASSSIPLHKYLLEHNEDKCEHSYIIPDFANNINDFLYLSGGVKWNLHNPKNCFPALKITFVLESEIIEIQEKKSLNDPWITCAMYNDRKMFLSDFLDVLPPGSPLLFILCRNGKKISIESMFHPVLPAHEGLKYYYSPYQSFKKEYEIIAGLVFMTLLINHFRECLPSTVRRLEGKLRYQDAIIITHLFNLSSTSRSQAVEQYQIVKEFELFAPYFNEQNRLVYKSISSQKKIKTIHDLRNAIMTCVLLGIKYYQNAILPNLEKYKLYLKENRLRTEIQALRDANQTWKQIDYILQEKYNQEISSSSSFPNKNNKMIMTSMLEPEQQQQQSLEMKSENDLISKYIHLLSQGEPWTNLLIFTIYFEKGKSIYTGFPYIFLEDQKIQNIMQIPFTLFAQEIYHHIQLLVQQFNPLFNINIGNVGAGSIPKRHMNFAEITGTQYLLE